MAHQVLVVYATKYGATKEIAEKIAETLREAGLHTDVVGAGQPCDLLPYTAVVLGSAVYIGQWRKEAVEFLKKNEKALTQRAVWLFSSGPTGEGDPLELTQGWRFPKGLQPIADRIQPRDIALFHGALFSENLNWIEKWALKNVKAQTGEYRGWEGIASWALGIAAALMAEPA